MGTHADRRTAESWLTRLFGSGPAREGGVIQHSVEDVESHVGREVFLREVERRGYQVVENGRQFVVFCNRAAIQRVWSTGFIATH
ncbi:MAG: hypothetical protein AUK37_09725 [Rhodobacterales bacterium CG2_30_65_12]|nr:MAG: hypothetical protein AUK37_09725 [Rhodobacterales bacterium CG2_30_65_12]